MAGCLWHKRPEPGLDPSHLWEKRKNTSMMRRAEAGCRVVGGGGRERWLETERGRQGEASSASDLEEDTEGHMCQRCVFACVCVGVHVF